ncbi:hypothetical protein M0804_015355 [Polistes exclamans]|nr:hypothetical protein M0804_015356 [Polistes exclamans]KAI4473430.1 hypothetical protein M0804_015355 [Polistes exclamans]
MRIENDGTDGSRCGCKRFVKWDRVEKGFGGGGGGKRRMGVRGRGLLALNVRNTNLKDRTGPDAGKIFFSTRKSNKSCKVFSFLEESGEDEGESERGWLVCRKETKPKKQKNKL